MGALEAARLGDEIGHTCAMKGLLTGIFVGLVATAFVLVAVGATVATGGAAAVVIGSLIAGAAGGGLAGMKIGATYDSDPKGPIISGSPNTFLGTSARPAARAIRDVVRCEDHTVKPIAQGSIDVFINQEPAARRTDMTKCSGKIREGQPDVFFGGPTGTYMEIDAEVPPWLVRTLTIAMWIGAGIATGGAAWMVGIPAALFGAGLSIGGGMLGGALGGDIGEYFGGARGRAWGEAIGGFGGSILGGLGAGRLLGASRPNTSEVEYGPDANYQKPDGSWDWPPDNGFAAPRQPETLPVGSRIDRFGPPTGRFLSPEGTPFNQRALAPSSLNEPYYAYRVAKPLDVQAGEIAPAFDQPGGGRQYLTGARTVQDLINDGTLVPIDMPSGPVVPVGATIPGSDPHH